MWFGPIAVLVNIITGLIVGASAGPSIQQAVLAQRLPAIEARAEAVRQRAPEWPAHLIDAE